MRLFQNRIESGSPKRSRGPGNSSRKKSASPAPKDRRPLGTILTFDCSRDDKSRASALATVMDEGDTKDGSFPNHANRSPRRSSVVLYRSVRRLERHFRQIRSSSRGTFRSICLGGLG